MAAGYLEPALRKFAERVPDDRGTAPVCKVYVYNKRRHMRDADIFADGPARNATLGVREGYGRIRMFRGFENQPASNVDNFGITLAHEFGHYGLFRKTIHRGQRLARTSTSTRKRVMSG
jgi:hypothetical protein